VRFDLDKVETAIAYKLLAATVVPRPIAWVITEGLGGKINAAPFSFFNVMGSNPPTVAIGLLAEPGKGFKDTARNILDTGQFVINLVPERLVEKMNITAVDAPAGINELALAGIETVPSAHVRPPRIADSPVAFECVNHAAIVTGPHQTVVIGRVLAVHIDKPYVKDATRGHVETQKLDLVARTFGSGYARTRDTFDLRRPLWADWHKRQPRENKAEPGIGPLFP
jgi:flavin reductase (DIM6/NTAB) family NADH-FMN oxidoreductase RutF